MAKLCMIKREIKRQKLVSRHFEKRSRYRAIIKDVNASPEEKWEAQEALQKLPRDSSPSRLSNRCRVTGRAHGVYRKFGLSRNCLRRSAMKGDVPGLKKASW